MKAGMRICYLGAFQRDHPRNAVFLRGLRHSGVEVVECHSAHPVKPWRYPDLAAQFIRYGIQTDIILVPAACHLYVFLAWLLARLTGKRLVFDPLVSMYDTVVQDRHLVSSKSLRARWYWLLDKATCTLADKVILDTELHVDYFVRTFELPRRKFCVVPVGADESIFFSHPEEASKPRIIEVLYAGNFIPLHGVLYIIEAARLLQNEPFHFSLIGDGQMFGESVRLAQAFGLKTVDFWGRLPREHYARMLGRADIALGIFGASDKARRIVPCKVFDACAMGKPVVTGDAPAIRALFKDGESIMLCQPNSGASLAEAIRRLGDADEMRSRIGESARALFDRQFSSNVIGAALLACLQSQDAQGHNHKRRLWQGSGDCASS